MVITISNPEKYADRLIGSTIDEDPIQQKIYAWISGIFHNRVVTSSTKFVTSPLMQPKQAGELL
jgi:hypothetical protein